MWCMAKPSPAQLRRSGVRGSGGQGVGQGIKGSQRVRLYKGVRGSWVQGVRGSGGQEAGQGVRGSGGQGFMGSGVRR